MRSRARDRREGSSREQNRDIARNRGRRRRRLAKLPQGFQMDFDCFTDVPFGIFQRRAGRDTAGLVGDLGGPVICGRFEDHRVSDTHRF